VISSSPDAPGLRAQLATVAGRSLTRTIRQRRLLILPFVFPMILFAINSSSLSAAAHIRGFPPVNYTAFALAVPFLMGAMLGAVSAGTDLAHDIESGFLGRLALTPMRRTAILFGQLGGALTLAVVQSIAFVLVGLAAGVTIASGLLGALVLIALSVLIALTFAAFGALLAVRTGRGAAVQGLFPLLFVTVFLSSAFLPRNAISIGWFHAVATYNPISYLVEGMRSLIITGWDAQALALGFGIAGGIAILSLLLADAGLKTRLVTA
jgi:ABC-2 type transport system permease protein